MIQENTRKAGNGFKTFFNLSLASVLIFCLQAVVFAANPANPETVLTVNTPINKEPFDSSDLSDEENPTPDTSVGVPESAWIWHPISVVNEPVNGFNAVRKTYALPPDVNPAVISTADFEMFGQSFNFAYVVQQPTSDESVMEMREAVTIEASSNHLNDILPNLEKEIWFDRDGFAGTLALDIHSVTSEAAGTTKHTSTATRQRTYPHLSTPDNALVPRTITDGGTTFNLSTVDWQSNSVSAVDGHPVASSYTANATYSAQVTQTRTTGYTVTAEYVGTVFRTTQGKTLYLAIFYGEPIIEIRLDEPEPKSTSEPILAVAIPVEPEISSEASTETIPEFVQPNGQSEQSEPSEPNEATDNEKGNAVKIALAVIGALIALAALGAGGFFLAKHFLGYNVTVYSIDGPREIIKAGKIKMNINSPEPAIVLDKTVGHAPAKTDRYIIQIAQRAMPKLINKTVRVVLHDKEAFHEVPNNALSVPVYEFEVNFSDDDEFDESDGAAGLGGYSFGGDAPD